ncbi:uncharacterized [Tachysurus ichikawai]
MEKSRWTWKRSLVPRTNGIGREKRGDAGRRGGARWEECRERMRLRGGARQSSVQQHTLVLPLLKSCLLD